MMNRFFLALILGFDLSGAAAQTLGNPTFNSLTPHQSNVRGRRRIHAAWPAA
jgi:hypothetical protein